MKKKNLISRIGNDVTGDLVPSLTTYPSFLLTDCIRYWLIQAQ